MPLPYQEESLFNMALAYLERINKLLYLCQQAAASGDVDRWTNYLRGVYREVSIRMKSDEKIEIEGDYTKPINFKDLTDNIIKEEEANFKNIYFLMNNPRYKKMHRTIILYLLDKLEIKIRAVLQKKGMGLPSKEDPRIAITQR